MSSGHLRVRLITGTIVAALALGQAAASKAAGNSDWVDDNDVTEFNLPRNEDGGEVQPQEAPRGRNQGRQIQDPSDAGDGSEKQFRPREPEHSQDDEAPSAPDKPEFVPPSDAVLKHVSDDGGVELGPNGQPRKTRAPLEASISTTRPGYSEGDGSGTDYRAEQLMARAPMLATPRSVNADPKVFKAWLNATHPGVLERATKEQIIEIKGEWDDAAHALRTFGLPYTRVPAKKFSEVNLNNVKIVVVNCEGHLPNEAILSLRRFVAMGGYLLTTDWALENVVERGFPGTVKWCQGSYTNDQQNIVVDAVVVGQDPEMIAGTTPVGHWQLVKKSQIAQVLNTQRVQVLARTRMMREDPNQLGILACVINHGAGKVMHLVGHFDFNSEMASNTALLDPAPGMGLSLRQALAANFVAQALKHGEPDTDPTGTTGK